MISICLNVDSRPGCDAEQFTVGDDGGQGSLHGCRSHDFMVDGAIQKLNFFRGYERQLILYVDLHDPVPQDVMDGMERIVSETGNGSMLICKTHDRSASRWYDRIPLEALKLATGEYVVHFDGDANAMCCFPCEVVDEFLQVLNAGLAKFVCQPSDMTPQQHKMWWASTRFFMCKRETLDIPTLERAVDNPITIFEKYAWTHPDRHTPCLEHLLGIMGNIDGQPGVIYPPLQPHRWIVWSWARYVRGTIAKLNAMSYEEASNIIVNRFGLCGPMDSLCQQLP